MVALVSFIAFFTGITGITLIALGLLGKQGIPLVYRARIVIDCAVELIGRETRWTNFSLFSLIAFIAFITFIALKRIGLKLLLKRISLRNILP